MSILKNCVQLVGYVGQQPEFKELEAGRKLLKASMATSETYKNQKGDKVEQTQWHKLIAWGKTAELMNKFLKKGSEVMIRGKLVYNSYEDKDGIMRYVSQVQVNEFLSLDKKIADPVPEGGVANKA